MKIKFHWGAIIFALIWAFAVLTPPVRDTKRLILSSSLTFQQRSDLPPETLSSTPNDPIITVWHLAENTSDDSRFKKWDSLIALYPKQTWIAAARLRSTFFFGDKPSYRQLPWKQQTAVLAERNRGGLRIAQQQAKHEPNNAFWPWMEATFLFALKQPKQAVTAIERASQLAVFQDYVRSTLLARLDWATQHDNLTWEERSRIYMGSSYNYRLYEVNYRAVQEAVQARSRGDNQTAIRIAAALLRANKVMRRAAETYYTEGSARGRGEIVLSTLFNRPFSVRTYRVLASQSSEAALKKYKSDLLQDWVNFVRANGRRDVENRADWLQTPPLSQQTPYSQINPDFKFDASVIRESIAAGSPFFLFGAFLVCFSFALVWLTGKMLLFHRSDDAAPTRGEVTTCANFSFWSLVACGVLVGALFIAIQLPFYNQAIYPFFLYNTLYYIPPVQLFGIATVGLGCWLLPIAFASWKRQNRVYLVRPETEARALSRNFGRVRIVVWLLFFVFVTLVASNGRGIWDNTPLQVPVTGTVAFICLAIAVTMEAVRFRRTGQMLPRFTIERTFPEPTQRRAWRWARNGAWIIVVAGFYAALPRTLWYQPLRFSITGLSIGAIAILIAIALSFKTLHRDSFFLRLATQSAGVLSIVCSFTFLLLALGVWPLRIELNRQLDRQLSMNEIDWMKEQIAKNSRPSP